MRCFNAPPLPMVSRMRKCPMIVFFFQKATARAQNSWRKVLATAIKLGIPHGGWMPKGRIALQDHGDKVWYRNIRIKPLE